MISEKTLTQTLETETSVSMNEIFLVSFKYPIDEIVVSSGHVLKAKRIYSQHTSAFLSSSNISVYASERTTKKFSQKQCFHHH